MNRKYFFLFVLCFINICFGMTWNEIVDEYKMIISEDGIFQRQYRACELSNAPVIVDPRIKEIPIYENGEALVDLRGISFERISMMPEPEIPFESADFNSGLPSASKMRTNLLSRLQQMLKALDELSSNFGYEPGQISIKVFEGLRDLSTQKRLFEKKMFEILLAHPEFTLEMAEQETSKWVSPFKNNVPVHSTGAAVDIRLWDKQKEEFLDMGSFGVIWGSHREAPTFFEDISDEQKRNRLYCLLAAEKVGLTNYVYEFWHFSNGDRYDIYWKNHEVDERCSLYGPIQ